MNKTLYFRPARRQIVSDTRRKLEGLFFLGFVDALCCPHFRVRVFFCGDDEKGERRNCFCDARARDSPSRPRPSACFARASGRISSQKNRGNRHYRRCQLRRPDWGNSPSEPELSFAVCLQRRPGAKEHGIYGCFLIIKRAQIWDLPMSVFLRNYYFFACAFSLFRAPARDWRDKNWKSRAQAFESREGRGDRHNPHNFWRVGRGGR